MKVTIENYLSFSCPVKYDIDSVYVNEKIKESSIETANNFKKPRAEKFSTYESIEGGFSFKYPSAFSLNEEEFEGSEYSITLVLRINQHLPWFRAGMESSLYLKRISCKIKISFRTKI